MDEHIHSVSSIEDGEAARIKDLEDKLASPELQGMDDARYWPRQAVFDELLDVLQARNRRRIEENWVLLEELVGHSLPR